MSARMHAGSRPQCRAAAAASVATSSSHQCSVHPLRLRRTSCCRPKRYRKCWSARREARRGRQPARCLALWSGRQALRGRAGVGGRPLSFGRIRAVPAVPHARSRVRAAASTPPPPRPSRCIPSLQGDMQLPSQFVNVTSVPEVNRSGCVSCRRMGRRGRRGRRGRALGVGTGQQASVAGSHQRASGRQQRARSARAHPKTPRKSALTMMCVRFCPVCIWLATGICRGSAGRQAVEQSQQGEQAQMHAPAGGQALPPQQAGAAHQQAHAAAARLPRCSSKAHNWQVPLRMASREKLRIQRHYRSCGGGGGKQGKSLVDTWPAHGGSARAPRRSPTQRSSHAGCACVCRPGASPWHPRPAPAAPVLTSGQRTAQAVVAGAQLHDDADRERVIRPVWHGHAACSAEGRGAGHGSKSSPCLRRDASAGTPTLLAPTRAGCTARCQAARAFKVSPGPRPPPPHLPAGCPADPAAAAPAERRRPS